MASEHLDDAGEVDEQPKAQPRPLPECTVPVRPGSWYARQAFKEGCEDEYSNMMKARYGGEW